MTIPLSRPPVNDEIKQAVLAAIDSRQYLLGPECRAFEAEFASYIGTKYAILTNSGTAALWLVFKALGLKGGGEVLVPSHTAFPTVEAICFAGGVPVFVDVDDSSTIAPKDAEAKFSSRTGGIVPVPLYGPPAPIDAVHALADRHGFWIVEDCC